ncbi:hypothetical protein PVAP13_4KG206935 [Panicum virgatum]|uniref:Uncharacterized protein n=1 Tax=Panicum virgatum TaxID=38727 RepID=A0A8T0TTU0_PANVG|nr:hypothetical protein PVAP13_4KG206935 [Panicum virgatum]
MSSSLNPASHTAARRTRTMAKEPSNRANTVALTVVSASTDVHGPRRNPSFRQRRRLQVEPERLGLRQRWSTATEWGSAPSPALSDCPDEFDRLVARLPRDLAGIRPLVPQLPPPCRPPSSIEAPPPLIRAPPPPNRAPLARPRSTVELLPGGHRWAGRRPYRSAFLLACAACGAAPPFPRGFCVVAYAFAVGETKFLPLQPLLFTRGKSHFAFQFCTALLNSV